MGSLSKIWIGLGVALLIGILLATTAFQQGRQVHLGVLRIQYKSNSHETTESTGTSAPGTRTSATLPGSDTSAQQQQQQDVPLGTPAGEGLSTPATAETDSGDMRLPSMRQAPVPNDNPDRQASDAHLRVYMPPGRPHHTHGNYADLCSQFHGSKRKTRQPWSDEGVPANELRPQSRHAIVTMAAGDRAGRGAVALMASLIQQGVCPGIDLVVMLAGGGTGSDECKQKKLGAIDCRAGNPSNKAAVISRPYIDALHAMGVQTIVTEPVPSKTAVIPGGRHTFWGLAISKLRLFGLPYDKLLWLDSDVFALHNLDHLLFYPEFTAAFTNDCCNKVSPLRISGGFWVVEPSPERYQHVATLFDGPDPLVEKNLEQANNHWHFGDMAVMLALFARVRKVPPYYIWPESYDLRQSKTWISQLYTGKRAQQLWNGTDGVMLGSPADITTIPLDESIDPAFHYVVAKEDANMADPVAVEIGHPELQGRVWHMLNESYDWLPVECTCIPNREQTPDKLYSLHFSCMPDSAGKPGDLASFEAQQASMDGEKFPPCLRKYFQKWMDAYKFGMGEYFGSIWRG